MIAGGFVLGETAVLLSETVGHVDIIELFVKIGTIVTLGSLGVWAALFVWKSLCPGRKADGRIWFKSGSRPRPGRWFRSRLGLRFQTGFHWLPFFLVVSFALVGIARAGYAEKEWKTREAFCGQLAGSYVTLKGRLAGIEESNGKAVLLLEDNWVYDAGMADGGDGNVKGTIPCVEASFRIQEKGGEDSRRGKDEKAEAEAVKTRTPAMKIGMRIQVSGKFMLFPCARNPGEFDYREYARAEGIDCQMYGEEAGIINGKYSPLFDFLYVVRGKAKKNINRAAAAGDAGIFTAAVLGDKKELDPDIKNLYQKNGIAHLLAISGLHLSIIGMGLYRLLRKVGLSYGKAGAVGGIFIICYGVMTGGSPSAIRAAAMMSTGFLAAWLGRTYDLISGASLAAVLLAWRSPWLLLQGGVQLSFGAVFAVGGVFPILRAYIGKGVKWLSPLLVSISIQLVTLPVILLDFYQFPVYGVFLNLLVIPLMGGVICSGLGAALLGGAVFWGETPVLGILASGLGHYILRFYEWLCRNVERLPFSVLVMGRPSVLAVALYYGVLLSALVWMVKAVRPAETKESVRAVPNEWKRVVLILGLCVMIPVLLKSRPVDGLEVTFLDVGQGDGMILRSGREVILVDGGSTTEKKLGQYRMEPCLKSYGISEVAYAFVSHGDKDHLSGIEYLLESSEEIFIENLMLPCQGHEDEALTKLAALAEKRGTRVRYIEAGERFEAGKIHMTCLYPGLFDIPSDKNDESEVLKMDYGSCHILFTGDMSGDGEKRMMASLKDEPGILREIQILKAAHHGSRFSSGADFLDGLGVRWAVISYGEGNSYGHPHKEVMDRLRERDVTVFETAKSGAVLMKTDGKTVRWRGFLE